MNPFDPMWYQMNERDRPPGPTYSDTPQSDGFLNELLRRKAAVGGVSDEHRADSETRRWRLELLMSDILKRNPGMTLEQMDQMMRMMKQQIYNPMRGKPNPRKYGM